MAHRRTYYFEGFSHVYVGYINNILEQSQTGDRELVESIVKAVKEHNSQLEEGSDHPEYISKQTVPHGNGIIMFRFYGRGDGDRFEKLINGIGLKYRREMGG